MSENVFKNIILGSEVIPPPEVEKSFHGYFRETLNVEWYNYNNAYEAIFYVNNIEMIARFNDKGKLVEQRVNLHETDIPDKVKSTAQKYGEIMNIIEVHSGNDIFYELIIRKSNNIRMILILSQQGEFIKSSEM